jgi:hypothetical protein
VPAPWHAVAPYSTPSLPRLNISQHLYIFRLMMVSPPCDLNASSQYPWCIHTRIDTCHRCRNVDDQAAVAQ